MARGELIARDAVVGDVLSRMGALERRCSRLEKTVGVTGTAAGQVAFFAGNGVLDATVGGIAVPYNDDNVSSPPTDAQLDSAFGEPDDLGDGWVGIVDDNGAGSTVWLCVVKNSKWWYEQLTAAV